MLMSNKLPQECLADFETKLKSPEPSKESLRSRKSTDSNNT